MVAILYKKKLKLVVGGCTKKYTKIVKIQGLES